jgi:uncharacterized repeat protein (TIGR03803 family)
MRIALAAVFAMAAVHATPASGQTLTTIASNGAAGVATNAPLLLGAHGKLFGTSLLGGQSNNGEVFELTPPAAGQTVWTSAILYQFGATPDGAGPGSGLTAGPKGVLYGTTARGGANGTGTVFQLTPPGAGKTTWTEQILLSLPNTSAAATPAGTLAIDKSGNLYGVTQSLQTTGTVYELSPPASGKTAWTYTVLYTFTGGADGGLPGPYAGPLLGPAGDLFGTTEFGGIGSDPHGTVWHLTPPGKHSSSWTETTLATFNGTNGTFAEGGLAKGPKGTLYGTASGGGADYNGVVFQLVPPPKGDTAWTFNVIWNFDTSGSGAAPEATPTVDAAGNVFGTTVADGNDGGYGNGVIFELSPPAAGNTAWQYTLLYAFPSGNQGGNPRQLIPGRKGVLYGSSEFGGTAQCSQYTPTGCGTAFALTGSGFK